MRGRDVVEGADTGVGGADERLVGGRLQVHRGLGQRRRATAPKAPAATGPTTELAAAQASSASTQALGDGERVDGQRPVQAEAEGGAADLEHHAPGGEDDERATTTRAPTAAATSSGRDAPGAGEERRSGRTRRRG